MLKIKDNGNLVGGFRPLKFGSKGLDVRRVQEALDAHQFEILVDGDFGPQTEMAVQQFQVENGLTVDGKVGPETYDQLFWKPVAKPVPVPNAPPPPTSYPGQKPKPKPKPRPKPKEPAPDAGWVGILLAALAFGSLAVGLYLMVSG